MSKRDARLFLSDILEAVEKIERYTTGLSFEQFESNDMIVDAVVRNLEIIGKAARHLPKEDHIILNEFTAILNRMAMGEK
jgi:uncharacterized protein with HEPN domain